MSTAQAELAPFGSPATSLCVDPDPIYLFNNSIGFDSFLLGGDPQAFRLAEPGEGIANLRS